MPAAEAGLKKGDVYEFTIVDEGLDTVRIPMVSVIIGEVKSMNNNMVKLAAWAYSNEPSIIRSESEITVVNCSDVSLDDWYKFMQTRLNQVYLEELNNGNDEISEEYEMLRHNFAKHLVEDVTTNRVSLVLKPDQPGSALEYYLYATPAKIFMLGEEPICKVTEELKMVVKDFCDIPVVFGHDVVVKYADYCRQVQAVKEATDKYVAEQLSTNNEAKSSTNNAVDEEHAVKNDGIKPLHFASGIEAAAGIDAADDRQYIIIVPKDNNKAEVTLTDDSHSILHSRHLIGKEVIVYGPVTDNYYANITDAFLHSKLI